MNEIKIADGDKSLEFMESEKDDIPDTTPWVILIVDDEPDVHAARAFSLLGVKIQGRPLKLIDALSAKAAAEIIESTLITVNVALVDCIMETDTAGIDLARHIKVVLHKKIPIIVIVSGHAGILETDQKSFPEIDGFLKKTDCTRDALINVLTKWLPESLDPSE